SVHERRPTSHPSSESQRLEPAAPPSIDGGLVNHSEEPRLDRGARVVTRPTIENFQICRLQDVLRFLPPPAAAGESPAIARRVKRFDFALERSHSFSHESRQRDFYMTRRDTHAQKSSCRWLYARGCFGSSDRSI